MGSEISVWVNGMRNAEIHTSCSQPIGIGLVRGLFEIVDGYSRYGGRLCPIDEPPADGCCPDGTKLRGLVLFYTGEGCEASNHGQDPNKVDCDGDPNFEPAVLVRVSDKQDPNDGGAKVWFAGEVTLQTEFTFDTAFVDEDHLSSDTFVHIFDLEGNLLQFLKFHTSCSEPMDVGYQFGSLVVVDCIPEDAPPPPGAWCFDDDAKPRALFVVYTGESCEATHHSQDSSKVECDGDPNFTSTVVIRASNKEDPNDNKAKVWFQGEVTLNDQFVIDAHNGGKTRLASSTFVHIFDLQGNLLQFLEFHTSCSQPLNLGDQFGSIRLVDFVLEGSTIGLPSPQVPNFPRPSLGQENW
jgi:hypothetical protein